MAAAAYRTPDLAERQVLIDFYDDAGGFFWHHRILLIATGEPGVWIATTPDWDTQRLNLNDHQVIPLLRNARLPAGYAATAYVFDSPVVQAEIDGARAAAAELREVLGIALQPGAALAGAPAALVWRLADTSSPDFGVLLPPEVVADAAQFVRTPTAGTEAYPVALVRVDGAWTSAAAVPELQLAAWTRSLVSEAGLDDRTTGDERDQVTGKRTATFRDTIRYQKELASPPFGVPGKRVVLELLAALDKSGLATLSGTCRAHRRISEALQVMQQTDQLNLPALAGAEILCRYLVQI